MPVPEQPPVKTLHDLCEFVRPFDPEEIEVMVIRTDPMSASEIVAVRAVRMVLTEGSKSRLILAADPEHFTYHLDGGLR